MRRLRRCEHLAFDATARGNWGCLPAHYPAAVALAPGWVTRDTTRERRGAFRRGESDPDLL